MCVSFYMSTKGYIIPACPNLIVCTVKSLPNKVQTIKIGITKGDPQHKFDFSMNLILKVELYLRICE